MDTSCGLTTVEHDELHLIWIYAILGMVIVSLSSCIASCTSTNHDVQERLKRIETMLIAQQSGVQPYSSPYP